MELHSIYKIYSNIIKLSKDDDLYKVIDEYRDKSLSIIVIHDNGNKVTYKDYHPYVNVDSCKKVNLDQLSEKLTEIRDRCQKNSIFKVIDTDIETLEKAILEIRNKKNAEQLLYYKQLF